MTFLFTREFSSTTAMAPAALPQVCSGSLDAGILGEATTQTEDSSSSSTSSSLLGATRLGGSSCATDDEVSESDSVIERLTRSVGRLFARVRPSLASSNCTIQSGLATFIKEYLYIDKFGQIMCILAQEIGHIG